MQRLSLRAAGGIMLHDNVSYPGSPNPMIVLGVIGWRGEIGPEQLAIIGNSLPENDRSILVERNGLVTLLSPTAPEQEIIGGARVVFSQEVTYASAEGFFENLEANFVLRRAQGGALIGMEVLIIHRELVPGVWYSEGAVHNLQIIR